MSRILVVDDEKSMRITLRQFLSNDGHQVQVAEDANTAINLLKTENFDVVVSDIIMPRITGVELLKTVRKISPKTQVILITGEPTIDTAAEALRAGAFDYLSKPVNKDKIITVVANAVKIKALDDERHRLQKMNERYQKDLELLVEKRTKALFESEKHLNEAQSIAHIGSWKLDFSSNKLFLSNEFFSILGLKEKRLLVVSEEQKNCMQHEEYMKYIHPNDRKMYTDVINETLENKKSYWMQYRITINNNEKIIEDIGRIVLDDSGNSGILEGTVQDITERKHTERQLQESEERWKFALEGAGAGVWDWNIRTDKVYFSEKWIEMLGYHKDEILGNPEEWYKMVHPDDRKEHYADIQKVIAKQEKYFSNELRVQTKNGSYKWILAQGMITSWDKENKPVRMIGTYTDITERELAKQALQESERYYRAMLNQLNESVMVIDQNYKITDVNQKVLATYDYKTEEIKGKHCYEVTHGYKQPCDKEGELCPLPDVFRTGKPANCLHKHIIKGKQIIWVDIVVAPFKDSNGKITHVIHSTRDISELMLAQEELSKLTVAIEQSPASVVITDSKGNIEYVNPKFTEVTDYTFEEVKGRNPNVLKSGEHPAKYYKKLWETITKGNTWHGEFHNKKKNGELFWEEATIGPITNEKGEITHFIALKEDITERKDLAQKLAQSQKLESIGQLAGGVAHDFNNLLTIINGYSTIILSKLNEDDPIRKDIKEIFNAGERAGHLTQQLLAFSRKQIIRPQIVNFNNLISEMEKMLNRLIGEDIILTTKLDKKLSYIKVDPGQIDQVIMNLAVNARDAMPEGGHLTIETTNKTIDNTYSRQHLNAYPGDYVMLSVTDTGTGMNEKTKAKIFEPFFTTKEEGKGTGLGLSTVYGIIKQNNGYIWVYSEPGIGTTFKIYLPVIEGMDKSNNNKSLSFKDSYSGTETILVTEDSEKIRELTAKILKEKGYKILKAANGKEALKIIETNNDPIDLIVTDVIMPQMGGQKLVKKIRKINKSIKVIYISGYTDDAISRHGILDESFPFLNKPFNPKDLLKIVRETLDEG